MKFLIDMALSPGLADWLRRNGHDAVHAGDLGLHRAPDTEIVDRARQDDRTIVTADLDFPRLLAIAQTAQPSLVLFRGGNWSEADIVLRMKDVLDAMPEADIATSIVVVDRSSIRRRRLPIQ